MKGLKTTIALAVVLAGLGGYIYFVDPQAPGSDIEEKEKAFAIEAADIEELHIKAKDGETTRLQKTDAGWRVVEPVQTDADSTELTSITNGLSSIEIQRIVDEDPTSVSDYGLAPPRIDVTFRTKGGKEPHHLEIGEMTPTGGDLYARQPSAKRVFLIGSHLENTFNRTTFDLRDKSVLKFEREKIDMVEVAQGGTVLWQFTKSGSDWQLTKPVQARAELSAIEGLLGSLSTTQVQKFVEPASSNLREYGLAEPWLSASVGSGSTRASLMVGSSVDGTRYAKDSTRDGIFTVGENLVTEFQKSASEFRKKDLFDFRSFSATRLEVQRGGATTVFEKTKDEDGNDSWRVDGKSVEAGKAEDPLMKLSSLRADEFEAAAHSSLDTPTLSVKATFDDGKTETVVFGRAGEEVYASRTDEPGSAKLPATAYEDAIKALDALSSVAGSLEPRPEAE